MLKTSHLVGYEAFKENRKTYYWQEATFIRAWVLCLVNEQGRNCPLLHSYLRTLEALLCVDEVERKKYSTVFLNFSFLNETLCKSSYFIG